MADYEERNEYEIERPVRSEAEPAAQSAAPQQAAPADAAGYTPSGAPSDPAAQRPNAAQEHGAYADAGYIPASDAGTMPRSYSFAEQPVRQKKEKRVRRGMHPAAVIALCLVCAILGGLACSFAPTLLAKNTPAETVEEAPQRAASGSGSDASSGAVLNLSSGESTKAVTTNRVSSGEMTPTEIYYNRALEQVVGVKTEITYTNYFGYTTKGAVSGSGFIISEDGYILTNYHVIEDAVSGGYEVQVLTHDGATYTAAVIGYEEDNDVALLKIDATGLNAAILGDSDAMLVGETVYAVGNPTGELEYSMTEGIVSAKDRQITAANSSTGRTETVNVFQTTAAINGGNSGGPIYNSRGEVIGIVVAKKVSTEIEGLAFAIPINDAVHIAQDLISDGFVRGKAYMGINVGTVTASAAQYYGLVQGALVGTVHAGSCAETAGLQESDIIVAIDGKEITSGKELIAAKKDYHAGDSAVLKVYRDGQYLELTITFDEATPEKLEADGKDNEETPQTPEQSGSSYEDFFREFFGGSPFGR